MGTSSSWADARENAKDRSRAVSAGILIKFLLLRPARHKLGARLCRPDQPQRVVEDESVGAHRRGLKFRRAAAGASTTVALRTMSMLVFNFIDSFLCFFWG